MRNPFPEPWTVTRHEHDGRMHMRLEAKVSPYLYAYILVSAMFRRLRKMVRA